MFHQLRYEGTFTPPSEQGTLVFPGNLGMFEWGGIAVDPVRQIAIANPINMPFVSKLLPRGPDNPAAPNAAHPSGSEIGVQPMYGAPFGVDLHPFLSPLGLPCMRPPWGYMAGIDLKTMKIAWMHRNGTIRDSAPLPIPIKMGVPSLGGPITTAGGVAFLTSTPDYYIRAYDVSTGAQLWQDRLPAGGQSTPMSYAVDGRAICRHRGRRPWLVSDQAGRLCHRLCARKLAARGEGAVRRSLIASGILRKGNTAIARWQPGA